MFKNTFSPFSLAVCRAPRRRRVAVALRDAPLLGQRRGAQRRRARALRGRARSRVSTAAERSRRRCGGVDGALHVYISIYIDPSGTTPNVNMPVPLVVSGHAMLIYFVWLGWLGSAIEMARVQGFYMVFLGPNCNRDGEMVGGVFGQIDVSRFGAPLTFARFMGPTCSPFALARRPACLASDLI